MSKAKESLAQKYEETDRALQRYRLPDHEDLKQVEKRLGSPILHTELVRKVTKLNPNVWAEDSLADRNVIGFYTMANGQKKYLVAFDKGWLPEFSYILTDRADLAYKEVRGWRTVLHRLLSQGALTMKQIASAFRIAGHSADGRWLRNTQKFRSN